MDIREKLKEICLRHRVADLYVFGSRAEEIHAMLDSPGLSPARPEPGPEPDVDIGILPQRPEQKWGAEKKVRLAMELEDLFGVGRVDLVLLPEADAFLALDIIRGELLFTKDPDRQARHELFVLRRAGDLMPFQKERTRMILEEGGR